MRRHNFEDAYRVSFSQVQRVLDQKKTFEPTEQSDKLLNFMLRDAAECDVEITPSTFTIRYNWHPSKHSYFPDCAPHIVAQLIQWANISSVEEICARQFGPGSSGSGAYHCMFGKRWLWILRNDKSVHISIRVKKQDHNQFPEALAPPLRGKTRPAFKTFDPPVQCPHCRKESTKLRQLTDAIVCPFCCRSFTLTRS